MASEWMTPLRVNFINAALDTVCSTCISPDSKMFFRTVYTEKEATAHHEAGHAVMAHRRQIRINRVSIARSPGRCEMLGFVEHSGKDTISNGEVPRERLYGRLLVSLAGLSAEYLFTGKKNFEAAASDLAVAEILLHDLTTAENKNDMAAAALRECDGFLSQPENWRLVCLVARYLLDVEETLDGKRLREVIQRLEVEMPSLESAITGA